MKIQIIQFALPLLLAATTLNVMAADYSTQSLLAAKSTNSSTGNTSASIYPETSVDMQLIKISEHTYYVQGMAGIATDNEGFISNAGVVITEEGVVLFDALGTPSLARLLAQKIWEITDKPVIKVIVSHYHADHFYGLQVFKDMGAEIIAPEGVEKYLQSDVALNRLHERRNSLKPWVNAATRIVNPDKTITGQSELILGGITFRLSALGQNHSHGDLVMQVSPDNVLFVGDLVFEQRIPFVVTGNSKRWLETLTDMNLDHVNVIVPGHGAASFSPVAALSATKDYLDYIRTTMQKAVDDMIPFDEAYKVDWKKYQNLPAFEQANRRNAYSVYLSLESDSMDGN
ncbi:MAG: MBL fold metallo-hydrolase [Gammaproteobacteria bacterium]|nr:MBL fold metallo-hydrolase [Gammaproteobacteria bacterium]